MGEVFDDSGAEVEDVDNRSIGLEFPAHGTEG